MDEWMRRLVWRRGTIEKLHDLGMSSNPPPWNDRQKQQLDSTWCENYVVREQMCVTGIFVSQIESMCVYVC